MSKFQELSKLQNVFRVVFRNDDLVITNTTSPKDIKGWDSFAHISLFLAIEDEFSVSFESDEIIKIVDVEGIINALQLKSG